MLSVNYERLAMEVLRQLRGRRSQVGFSRRLQYKSNVAYLWESGRNWPTAAKVMWAAKRIGVDVVGALSRFYRKPPPWLADVELSDPPAIARLMDDLRGGTSVVEIAKRCERSRYAVARWLRGQSEPRLPDFFRMIEATTSRLLDFIAELVDIRELSSVAHKWRQVNAARQLLATLPWSPAVLLAMQTTGYLALPKHEPGWIAARLGLPRPVEDECIELLAESGQIRAHGRRWRVAEVRAIDTRANPEAGKRLKQWWAQVGVDAIGADRPGLFSYNVFSISNEDYARLQDMHRAYYRAMRTLVAQSEPSERVVVANVQLFALDEAPSA